MGKHGRANIDMGSSKDRKSKPDNGDSRGDNEDKIPSHQKKVNFSESIETPLVLRTCQVILTRCDGFSTADPSFVAASGKGKNRQSGESIAGTSLKRSDNSNSGQANSEIGETPSRRFLGKQSLDVPASPQVGFKKHKCSFCSKAFTRSFDLKSHIRTHTGERPHKCQLCSKTFGRVSNLNSHIRSHTGERPHQCQHCSKSFRQPQHLQSHIRTHTGVRPYHCKLCSKSFGLPHHLKVHIRSHTDERPHQCQLCSKSFRQPQQLQLHIRTHTGVRPYHCQLCSKSFGQSGNLKRHIQTHHDNDNE